MAEKTYTVPNISCGHCVATIEREVGALTGVAAVSGDAATKRITITCEDQSSFSEIESLLREIGYPPES